MVPLESAAYDVAPGMLSSVNVGRNTAEEGGLCMQAEQEK